MATKATIRALRADEEIPNVEPRRYRAQRGYIKLRWLVDTQTYVEEYEHRLVAGRPPSWMHVHHINGIKHDNSLENLKVVTPQDHMRIHAEEAAAARGPRQPYKRKTVPPSWQANRDRAAKRRAELSARSAEMKRLYLEGKTTVEIGAIIGIHSSGVSRHLREIGVLTKPRNQATRAALPAARRVVQARSGMRCEKCATSTKYIGGQVHHRLPRGMGGTSEVAINSPSNLLNLCLTCHQWIESIRDEAYLYGWLVRQADNPAEVPVQTFEGWFLLLDDGTRTPTPSPLLQAGEAV
jgi:5-methylcytosine-specific restriction protein A